MNATNNKNNNYEQENNTAHIERVPCDAVAKTIIEQVEGMYNASININGTSHKISFFKMIGASDFVYSDDSLMFFAHGGKYAHKVKVVITLNSGDLYDVEFWLIGHGMCDKLEEQNDVFFDQLVKVLSEGLGV
jgi:hypothetical protein